MSKSERSEPGNARLDRPGAATRRIVVCVPVEIRADTAAVLDEACEDTARRMGVDRWTHYERGTATVKSKPGAYWQEVTT